MPTIDITTIGGTPLGTAQNNADILVNPNENALTQYATGLGVSLSLTLTTSVTLTPTQIAPPLWIFGGTPSGTTTLTIPVISFTERMVQNNSGQPITFTYGSGVTITIPTGNFTIYGDGTNVYLSQYSLGSALVLTVTGDVSLTSAQASLDPWIFNGSLGAGATITIPDYTFVKSLRNNTGQILTFGYSTGTTQTVATATNSLLMGDGTNVYKLI